MALRASEAKFRTIANAIPQMVWSTLADGYHDYYNDQWYEYTGVPVGATNGDAWNDIFHPEDQLRAWEMWRHCLSTGDTYEIQYRLRHHSRDYRWVLGRALPIRDESGKIIRWMGTCTDIHDQKIAEDRLRESDRRKDEFLAMLAHELRNPLAPIGAAAELLQRTMLDEERVRQTSRVIARQVDHMTSLINDLLDVSRVTRGLIQLNTAPTDIRHVVNDAVEQATPLMRARRHHLTMQLPPDSTIVNGDKKRLVQILANLLNNAAKYTPEGGNILLRTEVKNTHVLLGISDDGIGMEPELVSRVFDLFSQAERSSDRTLGGLGLGLALVKSLAELHGGTVSCSSEGIGKGSHFTVCLPRLTEHHNRVDELETEQRINSRFQSRRILVVDDNRDAAAMLAMYLEAFGHQVTVEHNAHRALERARSEAPEVFLLDIGLPEMDGNELAKRLRSQPENATSVLIAITGYGQEADRINSIAAGFNHHLIKPVDTKKLALILSEIHT